MARTPAVAALIVVTLALGALGSYARFDALGSRPLAVDEYYFARSVTFILESGVPGLPGGGYYVRGLVPQYATALLAAVVGKVTLAMRLFTTLCGLLTVGLSFVYCRRHVSAPLAFAVCLSLFVSSWEVEFSRFGRMYAPFQCVTLLFLIVWDEAYFRRRPGWLYLPHVMAGLAVLNHMMGVLLAPLLFVPLVIRGFFSSRSRALRFGIVSAVAAGLIVAFQKSSLRNWGVTARLPEDTQGLAAGTGSIFRLPQFPFWSVSDDPQTNLIALGAALVVLVVVLLVFRRRSGGLTPADVVAAAVLLSAMAHAFVISGLLFVLLLFRYRLYRLRPPRRLTWALLGLSAVVSAGWLAYAWISAERLGVGSPGGPSFLGAILPIFFGWPDLYPPLVKLWAREFPLLGALTLLALTYLAARLAPRPAADWLSCPGFVVIYVALCISTLETDYASTRYGFFVYPVVLSTIALALEDGARRLGSRLFSEPASAVRVRAVTAATAVYLLLFLVSRDFNPRHLLSIGSGDVGWRLGPYASYAATWYPRQDHRSPGEYVAGAVGPRDVIVVVDQPPVSYYIDNDHAVYYRRDGRRFRNVSREKGTLDLWSGRRLVSTAAELERLIEGTETLWLVRGTDDSRDPHIESLLAGGSYAVERMFVSQDGRLEVLRVRPRYSATFESPTPNR